LTGNYTSVCRAGYTPIAHLQPLVSLFFIKQYSEFQFSFAISSGMEKMDRYELNVFTFSLLKNVYN
jgi:hypothetical protein